MRRLLRASILLAVCLILALVVSAAPATLTLQDLSSSTPITPAFTSVVTDGVTFNNNGRVMLYITNDNITTVTITATTPVLFYGMAVGDMSFVVGPGASKVAGPFQTKLYNDADENVTVTASPFLSVTVSALRY